MFYGVFVVCDEIVECGFGVLRSDGLSSLSGSLSISPTTLVVSQAPQQINILNKTAVQILIQPWSCIKLYICVSEPNML